MSDNATSSKATPPYTSFPSFKTLLKNLKEHGMPSRVDRSVLGSSFSNAVGSQLLTALKFLTLTGADNHPTDDLELLVHTFGTDDWKGALEAVLRKSYAPLFSLDLDSASPNQFNEKFRSAYGGADEVQRKSMTFFLTAAQDAGIKVSPYIMKNKKPRSGPSKKRAPKAKADAENNIGTSTRNNGRNDDPPLHNTHKLPSEILLGLFAADMGNNEKTAIWTLIQFFKENGK
jgi:hypothetical protein